VLEDEVISDSSEEEEDDGEVDEFDVDEYGRTKTEADADDAAGRDPSVHQVGTEDTSSTHVAESKVGQPLAVQKSEADEPQQHESVDPSASKQPEAVQHIATPNDASTTASQSKSLNTTVEIVSLEETQNM